MGNKKNYKVLFIDLDGTLIKTKSGKTFPEGIWDMDLRMDVFETIRIMNPDYAHIVSNQGGVGLGYIDSGSFQSKMMYVTRSLFDYLNNPAYHIGPRVSSDYCTVNQAEHPMRKPNTGMLEEFANHATIFGHYDKSEMLMVGDASGLQGQFSDSDKKTAENFGIDYMDVEEFIKTYK